MAETQLTFETADKGVLTDELRDALRRKRLIFTVTTGRSGTEFLATALGHLPGVTTRHEADPDFADVMRPGQRNPQLLCDFWQQQKLPKIAGEPGSFYVETSHLFCKGFVEPLLELNVAADLILLKRPHRDVACSLYALNTIPGRGEAGLKYLIGPDDPDVLALPGWQDLHDYQLCYWYCLEMERRAVIYRRMFEQHGARVAAVSLRELSTLRGFEALLDRLELPRLSLWGRWQFARFARDAANRKSHKKREMTENLDCDALESALSERLVQAAA